MICTGRWHQHRLHCSCCGVPHLPAPGTEVGLACMEGSNMCCCTTPPVKQQCSTITHQLSLHLVEGGFNSKGVGCSRPHAVTCTQGRQLATASRETPLQQSQRNA
jgi:hypothetical protein